MRPMMAADASQSLGISLERTCNLQGNFPVHWSRYLRLTVRVSSPPIDSSRSTTTALSRPTKRASATIASALPISGARPNSPPRLLSVGPATLAGPTPIPKSPEGTPQRHRCEREAVSHRRLPARPEIESVSIRQLAPRWTPISRPSGTSEPRRPALIASAIRPGAPCGLRQNCRVDKPPRPRARR